MERTALYVGIFDPVTEGHMWVIETAIDMFDKLIIAVGDNPDKKYMFSSKKRKKP